MIDYYKKITDFDDLTERENGEMDIESQNLNEESSQMFVVSKMLKKARKEAKMTQEQLAEKTGTKKSYISKIEHGKGNIKLSTLFRLFEKGLNRKIGIVFLE